MKPVRRVILVAAGLTAFAVQAHADRFDREVLIEREREWSAAYLRHDAPAVARLLSDDYVGIDGRGIVSHKVDELEEAEAPPPGAPAPGMQILGESLSDFDVRFYGEVGIVNSVNSAEVSFEGKQETIRYRRTTVWHKKGKNWECVAFHGTRIITPS